jgi:hypothetical protein
MPSLSPWILQIAGFFGLIAYVVGLRWESMKIRRTPAPVYTVTGELLCLDLRPDGRCGSLCRPPFCAQCPLPLNDLCVVKAYGIHGSSRLAAVG